jgi:ATP-dependent Clp protease adaptor protein ClpS
MAQNERDETDNPETETEGGEGSTMIAPKVKVIFVDDDKTPVDFVLFALETFLGYDEPDAQKIVQNIASQGEAVVAELPAVPAELAKKRIEEAAADAGWPFQVRIEGERTL